MIEAMAIANFMRRKIVNRVSLDWRFYFHGIECFIIQRLGTIAAATSDEEEIIEESDRAALLPRVINEEGRYLILIYNLFRFYLDVYVSTGTEERHDFDIVEKIEMVSGRRCETYFPVIVRIIVLKQ